MIKLADPTRFERATFAFGGLPPLWALCPRSPSRLAGVARDACVSTHWL